MTNPLGLATPAGLRLLSIGAEPSLWPPMNAMCSAVWPEFMLHDAVVDRHWHRLRNDWPAFQHVLVDDAGTVVAASQAAPLCWDGTDDGLPMGWDDQLERSVADLEAGHAPNTLGALQIAVAPARRGEKLSAFMLEAMRSVAAEATLEAVIACVRPTDKVRYPLMSIETYAIRYREDGLPCDPWLRVHVRAGGRIVRASPRSMTISGSVSEWRSWTGLEFPATGPYVVAGALAPIEVDLEAGTGVYHDPNVWVVHRLDR